MKKDSLEDMALRVLSESKIKTWNYLDSTTQEKIVRVWAMHNLGNLNAESSRVKDAIAEIYQLSLNNK